LAAPRGGAGGRRRRGGARGGAGRTWLRLAGALAVVGAAAAGEAERACAPLPRIIIGCWQLLERDASRANAVATLTAYADAGFTAFDTADIYGPSESILGDFRAAYAGTAPLRFFTKYVTSDASRENAVAVNRQSRRALGVDALDLVQFHWWDFGDARYVDAARELVQLRAAGKIVAVAACNFDAPHLRHLLDAGVPLVANQVQYSLLDRRPENGVVALASERGLQLTCFGAVAGGWLSDAFLGAPEPSHREVRGFTVSRRMSRAARVARALFFSRDRALVRYKASLDQWARGDWALFQDLLAALRAVGDDLGGASIAAVAVAWVLDALDRTCGGSVILGVRDAAHVADAVVARDLRLGDGHRAHINAVLARGAPPEGDIWSRERG